MRYAIFLCTHLGSLEIVTREGKVTLTTASRKIFGPNGPIMSRHFANYVDALEDLKLVPSIGTNHGKRSVEGLR